MDHVIIIKGSKVIDCRTRWQKFKDWFKPRKPLIFDSTKTIVYDSKKHTPR